MSWDLDLDEAGWFFGPERGQPVCGLRDAHARWLSQWVESWRWTNCQHREIVCVSLSSCRKPKLKEGNKSFVSVPKESSVFRIFRIPMRMNILWTLWTFYASVYLYSRIKKMVLDASLLNTQHYKVRIKGKVEQSRKGVAPSPTPMCSKLSKREPSGHPRLWSPTLLTYYGYVTTWDKELRTVSKGIVWKLIK